MQLHPLAVAALAVSLFFAGAAVPGAAAADDTGPSFDCSHAAQSVETLLCTDGGLAALDRALAAAFDQRRSALPAGAARDLLQQQRAWLKARSRACPIAVPPAGSDEPAWPVRWRATPCLAKLYRERLAVLGAPVEVAAPTALASRPDYIHPLCIGAALPYFDDVVPPAVPVGACNAGNAVNPPVLQQDGLVVRSPSQARYPYYAYRYLGKLPDGREAGLVRANAGNTLDWTGIVALRLQPRADGENMLTAEPLLTGGDRCAGSFASARLAGGKLSVTENVTPAGLIQAAGGKAAELPDCAACCTGTVSRSWPAAKVGGNGAIDAATLESVADDDWQGEAPGSGDYCFGKALGAVTGAGPQSFDAVALAAVGRAFNSCLAAGK